MTSGRNVKLCRTRRCRSVRSGTGGHAKRARDAARRLTIHGPAGDPAMPASPEAAPNRPALRPRRAAGIAAVMVAIAATTKTPKPVPRTMAHAMISAGLAEKNIGRAPRPSTSAPAGQRTRVAGRRKQPRGYRLDCDRRGDERRRAETGEQAARTARLGIPGNDREQQVKVQEPARRARRDKQDRLNRQPCIPSRTLAEDSRVT
jgi:hypothetical protein